LGYRKKNAKGKNKGNVALEHPEEVGTKATSTSPHLMIFARTSSKQEEAARAEHTTLLSSPG